MRELRLCKDCIHFTPDSTCDRTEIVPDYVNGHHRYRFAENERASDERCGKAGRFFEFKPCKPPAAGS
jgi:hypothetical protein